MANNLQEKHVVTCFLESKRRILLLRRSDQVGSYQGRWAGVSGYIESSADAQALLEILEETGLFGEHLKLGKRGELLAVDDEELGTRWIVHPYLFHIKDRKRIKIDWEHTEIKWIKPKDLAKYDTVPMLRETLARVYDS
ncbi:NUDIX domain-containing protein [Chloroflexota bacterium]